MYMLYMRTVHACIVHVLVHGVHVVGSTCARTVSPSHVVLLQVQVEADGTVYVGHHHIKQ